MATTEQFSLRWNNFHSNLTAGFHELLENSDMVDVTLAVDGRYFLAHKVVLSICSPYFKQMFKLNPCKHPIVILKDVGAENMKDILEFIYLGEVNVLKENLATFLRTAELLQVKGLTGDDSSETSSRKDDKCESLPDNDEDPDFAQFGHLIDSDVELPPPHYSTPTRVPTPPSSSNLAAKRQAKTSLQNNTNTKKTKSDYLPKPIKTEAETSTNSANSSQPEDVDLAESALKSGQDRNNSETEETKDNLKQILENSFGNSGQNDASLSDQGRSEPKSLANNNRHTNHETRTLVNRLYQCTKCCKKFSRRDHLRTHEKNIHGEDAGPFACVICSQLYKNTESLRKHLSKFHFPKMNENRNELSQKVEVKA